MKTHRQAAIYVARSAVAATACALIAAIPSHSSAAAEPSGGNEQVALYNESGRQADFESELNGTAQVTPHDGRFVVFSTAAPLLASDTNQIDDVYLRDTTDNITILVSAKHGRPGNNYNFEPTISADGRYIAWTTRATNLTRDTNGSILDVVVKDMYTDKIQAVSVRSDEKQAKNNSFSPVISGNGRHVAFQSFGRLGPKDLDKKEDVYVRDVREGATPQVSLLPGSGKDVRESVLVGDGLGARSRAGTLVGPHAAAVAQTEAERRVAGRTVVNARLTPATGEDRPGWPDRAHLGLRRDRARPAAAGYRR